MRGRIIGRIWSAAPSLAELRDLPLLVRIGTVLLIPGLLADVLVHGGFVSSAMLANGGHVLVLGGMLLALAGAIARGVRQSTVRREEM